MSWGYNTISFYYHYFIYTAIFSTHVYKSLFTVFTHIASAYFMHNSGKGGGGALLPDFGYGHAARISKAYPSKYLEMAANLDPFKYPYTITYYLNNLSKHAEAQVIKLVQ